MTSKYFNPYTDFGFKKLFGEECCKYLLMDFLNQLLPSYHQVVELSFKNPEKAPSTPKERKAIFNIYCQNVNGERFVVEMQKANMHPLSTLYVLLLSLLLGGIHNAVAEDTFQQTQPANLSVFNFSGYTSLVVDAPAGDKTTLSIDDLSLFITGHINQTVNPFLEAELDGVTLLRQGEAPLSKISPQTSLERLYNDSYLTNNLSLRVGKMLSPVGEWNLIHAAPLVWTTTRPITTERGFSDYTSGASLIYNDAKGRLPDVQFYVQPAGEFRPTPSSRAIREYERVSGFHLNFPSGLNDKLGFSFQHAQVKNTGVQQNLIGFNFNKELGSLELESEAIHTHISDTNNAPLQDSEWGAYLQGVYALDERWHLIARYENFVDRDFSGASKNALLGIFYKSASPLVWKFEYIEQDGRQLEIQTGLYASFSMLF